MIFDIVIVQCSSFGWISIAWESQHSLGEQPLEIHPQLKSLLARLAAADYPDQTKVTLGEAREITDDRANS